MNKYQYMDYSLRKQDKIDKIIGLFILVFTWLFKKIFYVDDTTIIVWSYYWTLCDGKKTTDLML